MSGNINYYVLVSSYTQAMKIQAMMPKTTYPRASQIPPKMNQMIFSSSLMLPSLVAGTPGTTR